ncbi:alternate-type signal peptide domain-containing protein [Arthrobacter sp. ISL-85]|uniref:alternate-type signal peptide domain-containing protein n=1 Tax=Arthrobacter sp. ISL-85 TaxID=2819115 RepID=UPI001BECC6A7|nr:alternate-type signal peptide domain-containing protein [Arthrobacter sp. ISL-85]MBT2567203.1 alternate-type signal peptide domain-containing protein [Arthrobacter sp. ISL-85]
MKNSTLIKGTAAIAVGAALLLGGGGTLANWNAEATAAPGTIVSGDLNVTTGSGTWTDRSGNPVNIAAYKVVPGDKLTFTQTLNVTLVGDKMAANVATTGTATNGFTPANVSVSAPVLTVGGTAVSNPLKPTGSMQTVTATVTFEFLSTTTGRADTTASYNFNNVAFQLTQITQPGLS